MSTTVTNPLFEFQWLRNKNQYKYRTVCQELQTQLDPSQLIKYATIILKRDPSDRFEEELLLIVKATENLQFFKEMNSKQKNIDNRLHTQCCQKMTYKAFQQGETVFKQGDKGENAFIILSGSVNIYSQLDQYVVNDLSYKSRKKFENCTQQQKRTHPISVINQAKREKMKNRFSSSVGLMKKLKRQNSKQAEDEQFHSIKLLQTQHIIEEVKIEEEKDKKILEIQYQMGLEMTAGIPPSKLDIDYFFIDGVFKHKFVIELVEGQMFGELALIWNQPRSATVVAKSNLELAVLTSQDYKSLLKDAELNKIEQRIKFFQNYFFRECPRFVTLRYCYNFKKIELRKGNFLIKKGDKVTQIYLLKKGELEVLHEQEIINQVSEEQQSELASSEQQLLLAIKQTQMKPPKKMIQQRRVIILSEGEIIGDVEIMLKMPLSQQTIIVKSEKAKIYGLQMNHFNRILSDQTTLKKYFYDQANMKYQHNISFIKQIDKFHQSQYEKVKLNQQLYLIKLKNENEKKQTFNLNKIIEESEESQLLQSKQQTMSIHDYVQEYPLKLEKPLTLRNNLKQSIAFPSLQLNQSNSPLLGSMTSRIDSKSKDIEEDYELQVVSLKGVLNKIKFSVNHKSSQKILRQKKTSEQDFRKQVQIMQQNNDEIKKYDRKHVDLVPENEKIKIKRQHEASELIRQEMGQQSQHLKKFIEYQLMKTEMSQRISKSIDQSDRLIGNNTPISKGQNFNCFSSSYKLTDNRILTESIQSPSPITQSDYKTQNFSTSINIHKQPSLQKPVFIKSEHNLFRMKPQSRLLQARYSNHSVGN
ncbi:unnamed protein product [Paramecium sonneborni]|uniref:Cyclic nucleotide-binding domain-containing protein n=1 Tax=Paramecium sonneborni TaxID=65129 RepID=A0A8S1KPM2_9CILI|nr:unnamed protein product [Paramecium sonneborni]